jgi:integrase
MPGRQAKIITPAILRRMLGAVANRQTTSRDRVIILLSAKAGLRACEIARLDWSMVLDARGRVADCLAVRDAIAKKRAAVGASRCIPASSGRWSPSSEAQ